MSALSFTPPGLGNTNGGGVGASAPCAGFTNFTVGYQYWTNSNLALAIAPSTNNTIALTIQTPTTNVSYDLFGTTNLVDLAPPSFSRTNWAWLTRARGGSTNFSWGQTNWCERYFQLGTMQDSDHDGLSDAYENLVSHTRTNDANLPGVLYETVITNQNPSAWFKLNGASLTNSVTSGEALTNGGGFWSSDAFAVGNSAYSFSTNLHKLVFTNDALGGGTGDATNQGSFTLLFKAMTRRATAKRYVLSQGTAGSNAIAVYFDGTNSTDASLTGALRVGVGTNDQAILSDTNLVHGAWYYLAVTCYEANTNDAVHWYLGQVGSQTLQAGGFALGPAQKFGTTGAITLGNKDESTNSAFRESSTINGSIDQVVFWRRELTAAEVNAQFDTLHALFQGPAKVFDLTRWELTLPVDATNQLDNAHEPLDISTTWLNSGFRYVEPLITSQQDGKQRYFYLSTSNTMVFEAPWNGADQDTNSPATNGSPRSELRETKTDGNEFNWKPYDPATGTPTNTHTLLATCRLESVPSKVIFGQIHADTPVPAGGAVPAVTLFHEGTGITNKRIRLAVYYSPDRSVTNSGGAQTLDIVSGVNVGDRIDYELKLEATTNGTVTLKATVAVNEGTPSEQTVRMNNPADTNYSGWGATNVTLYFKAGCYFPKAANNSGTARVSFSSLRVTHQP